MPGDPEQRQDVGGPGSAIAVRVASVNTSTPAPARPRPAPPARPAAARTAPRPGRRAVLAAAELAGARVQQALPQTRHRAPCGLCAALAHRLLRRRPRAGDADRPSRNRDGRRAGPGRRVCATSPSDTPAGPGPGDADVEQPALLLDLGRGLGVADRQRPLVHPARKTHPHSRPFAACSVASVTPSATGACWIAGPPVELGHERGQPGIRRGRPRSPRPSGPARLSDSQRSRTPPVPAGASADQPALASTSFTVSTSSAAWSSARAAPRSSTPPAAPRAARRIVRRPAAPTGSGARPAPARSSPTGR